MRFKMTTKNFQAMRQVASGQEMELENMAHVCCLLLQLRSRRVLPYTVIIPFSRSFTAGKASRFQLESAHEISWHVRTACQRTVIHQSFSFGQTCQNWSIEYPWYPASIQKDCDCYDNFLMNLVTSDHPVSQDPTPLQLFVHKLFYVSVDTICWLPK